MKLDKNSCYNSGDRAIAVVTNTATLQLTLLGDLHQKLVNTILLHGLTDSELLGKSAD